MICEVDAQYYRPSDIALASRCWDGNCVVYHELSGDTHLLSSVDWEVLSAMDGRPVTLADLFTKVRQSLGERDELYLSQLLEAFVDTGLIETLA